MSNSGRPFATLEPRIRHVSEGAVRKKWKKLNDNSQHQIRRFFLSLEGRTLVDSTFCKPGRRDGDEAPVEALAQR